MTVIRPARVCQERKAMAGLEGIVQRLEDERVEKVKAREDLTRELTIEIETLEVMIAAGRAHLNGLVPQPSGLPTERINPFMPNTIPWGCFEFLLQAQGSVHYKAIYEAIKPRQHCTPSSVYDAMRKATEVFVMEGHGYFSLAIS
jgi:hypothetical protein